MTKITVLFRLNGNYASVFAKENGRGGGAKCVYGKAVQKEKSESLRFR